MHTPFTVIALCTCALWLGACDKTPTVATPMVTKPAPTGAAGSAVDPSVPSAASVLPPANVTNTDPALGRSNSTMSAAQESTAMPMPGQNNDHSAPLGPAKRANSP